MSQTRSHNLLYMQLLVKQGLRSGDLMAVITPSSLVLSKLLSTALHIGVTVFPLDPYMARERRNSLLTQAGVDLVLTDMELHDLPPGVRSILIPTNAETCAAVEPAVFEGQIQLIVATSGSEGEPKGVLLSGENIAASVAASRSRLGLQSEDVWLNCLPMFHIGGAMILYRCLDAGAGMLLHQGFAAEKVWADLNSGQVSHISLVPAMLAQLLDVAAEVAPPENLRVTLVGGGGLSSELASRAHAAGWPLCVSYGMSETCSQCVTDCSDDAGLIPASVGLPLDGFEIALSNNSRIKVRGPAVMQGYVNPDKSLGHGLSQDGWFETGDLGQIDRSGCLRVLGRADDILISGGNTIHPLEIENLMINCPGVDGVAISSRMDRVWGDVLVALYTGNLSSAELESWCRINLSSTQRPREFIRLSELPRNAMGKLDRKSLKAMADQS